MGVVSQEDLIDNISEVIGATNVDNAVRTFLGKYLSDVIKEINKKEKIYDLLNKFNYWEENVDHEPIFDI